MKLRLRPIGRGLALAFGGLSAAAIALPALAQQQQLERVEITGSLIKRVETEGALPVQIVTKEDIARSGASTTEQLLQQISAVGSAGGFSIGAGAGLSTYGVSTVSLRGLSDERTLVLVNGRRIASFAAGGAAVNVNAIPLAAIERVEVLKDGASAIYGSDAIAGVVNFILTRNFQGVEVGGYVATPTRGGGGDTYRASIVAGFGDLAKDRFNVTVSASYERNEKLWSKDRDFAKTGNVPPFTFAGATGQGNIEGAFTPGTGSAASGTWVPGSTQPGFGLSPGRGYGNPLAAANNCGAINMYLETFPTTKGAPFCSFDSSAFLQLLPDREATNVSANFVYRLNNRAEVFGDALYAENTVTLAIQPSPVRFSFLQTATQFPQQGVDPALLIFPSNPNYQIAANYLNANGFGSIVGQPLAVTARVFDFGLRTVRDKSEQSRLVGGLRGQIAGQDYEVAYSHNESKLKGAVTDGYFSQLEYARIVQNPANQWNPWSLTQSAAFNAALPGAKYAGPTLNAEGKTDSVDGKLTGELFALPAGMAQYAAGAYWYKESYIASPSPALATGDIAGLGGATPPLDRDRRVTGVFAEVSVPVLQTVETTLAARYDKYNDVGSTTNYKAGLRWQPVRNVLVRGSLGTGFRAPTLVNLWEPQTLGTSALFTDPLTGQANLQVNEFSGGNPDLKPEESKQRSLGIVVEPTPGLTMSVDYFKIKVDQVLATPSTQEVVSGFRRGDSAYSGLVELTPEGDVATTKAVLSNTGSADLSGYDVEVNYRRKMGPGTLGVSLFGTYMTKFDMTSPGGFISHKVGRIVDDNGDPVIASDVDGESGGVVLRWKHVLSGTWQQGPWAFTLTQNFFKRYETGRRQLDGEQNFVPDYSIYDTQIAYTGIKNLRIAVGAKNVFDKNPAIYIPVSNQFQSGYDVSLYDPRSRFMYVNATYKFF